MKYAGCNDAWKNEDFEKACKEDGMNIQFKCTPPGTPQQNDRVEREIVTVC